MSELSPDPEWVPRYPAFEVDVDYATMYALGEYAYYRGINYTQAATDMTVYGLKLTEFRLQGCIIEHVYPPDEKYYTVPVIQALINAHYSGINVAMEQSLQDALEQMTDHTGLTRASMFERFVQEGSMLHATQRCSGRTRITYPDGRQEEIILRGHKKSTD